MEVPLETDVEGATSVGDRRDELVDRVTAHAGQIARELAVLKGGDFGKESFETDRGTWTIKYEAGAVQYLLFGGGSGAETYVVSTKQPPEADALAEALADYGAFVEVVNDHIRSFEGLLADVSTDFPSIATTEALAAERDRIVDRIRTVGNDMAGQLYRIEGEYGTYACTVSGSRWELKWDGDAAAYLRVGGEDGVYLISQYGPPAVSDLRRFAADVPDFVRAFNEHVRDLDADLEPVSIADPN